MNYNIDPNKYYSARAVLQMGILPWRSPVTFSMKLSTEQKWIDIFNPIVDQKNRVKRYHIKGENIIKFIDLAEKGEL